MCWSRGYTGQTTSEKTTTTTSILKEASWMEVAERKSIAEWGNLFSVLRYETFSSADRRVVSWNFHSTQKVGDDYIYWTDYYHKNLWALRKDGSSKSPKILRTYSRNPAMGVVIFRRQPLDYSSCLSPEFHGGISESKEEITAAVLSIICLVVLGIAITVVVWWSSFKRLLTVRHKNEDTFTFRNFQNCSSSVTMSEMVSYITLYQLICYWHVSIFC